MRDEYRSLPERPAIHAGKAYEADAQKLRAEIEGFFQAPDGPRDSPQPEASRPLKGLIVPHIDYQRGGRVYAWAYRELVSRGGADLYVILGTCHNGLAAPFAATRKSYETPLGPAETDAAFLEKVAALAGSTFSARRRPTARSIRSSCRRFSQTYRAEREAGPNRADSRELLP